MTKEEKINTLIIEQMHIRRDLQELLEKVKGLRYTLKHNVQRVNWLSHQIRNPELKGSEE